MIFNSIFTKAASGFQVVGGLLNCPGKTLCTRRKISVVSWTIRVLALRCNLARYVKQTFSQNDGMNLRPAPCSVFFSLILTKNRFSLSYYWNSKEQEKRFLLNLSFTATGEMDTQEAQKSVRKTKVPKQSEGARTLKSLRMLDSVCRSPSLLWQTKQWEHVRQPRRTTNGDR